VWTAILRVHLLCSWDDTMPKFIGWDVVLRTFCLSWPWTLILLISASWVAGITGMSHHTQSQSSFKNTHMYLCFHLNRNMQQSAQLPAVDTYLCVCMGVMPRSWGYFLLVSAILCHLHCVQQTSLLRKK
jgi:hypothetical protein